MWEEGKKGLTGCMKYIYIDRKKKKEIMLQGHLNKLFLRVLCESDLVISPY